MILRCFNPSGQAVAIRCKVDNASRLAYRLSGFGFNKFEAIPHYTEFHTLQYVSAFTAMNHYLVLLNEHIASSFFVISKTREPSFGLTPETMQALKAAYNWPVKASYGGTN
jgi:hypothetical protein